MGDSFKAAVESLKPGDTLIVHRGTYSVTGITRLTVRGTANSSVLVKGAEGEDPPLITHPASAETISTILIEGSTYLTISRLEITCNGGDGIRLTHNPSNISLEDLIIHDVDVGINFRSNMHHITVRRNHIYQTGALGRTGEGMYVGCNYAECIVRDSLIEGNWIHDTLAASQGDGIEIKRGSHSIIVRDNTIYDTKYPCMLLVGTEGKGRNIVEGNVMWNCGDSGIQATADAVIRNNIILGGPGIGFNSQDHQEVIPGNLEFVHNTIVGGEPCLRLSNWDNKLGMVFANNAIYCEEDHMAIFGLEGVTVSGNVVLPRSSKLPSDGYIVGRSPLLDFVDVLDRDLYPTEDSRLIASGDELYVTEVDFNGTTREGIPDAGAYAWAGERNPGWKIVPGFKKTFARKAKRGTPRVPRVH